MGEIMPLALTMMIGPQIMTPIILLTAKKVVRPSLAFIAGVAVATLTGTLLFAFLAGLFDWQTAESGEPSQLAQIIQTALVILLIIATIRTYLKRETVELPKWLSDLQEASSGKAFKLALMLIYLMPTDVLVMLTVGLNLASRQAGAVKLLPFLALTVFIAALPLLTYLAFGKKAVAAMPKVRTWMSSHSWVVSVTAYVIFIFLLLG